MGHNSQKIQADTSDRSQDIAAFDTFRNQLNKNPRSAPMEQMFEPLEVLIARSYWTVIDFRLQLASNVSLSQLALMTTVGDVTEKVNRFQAENGHWFQDWLGTVEWRLHLI